MLNVLSIISALVRLIPDIIKGLRLIEKELNHGRVSQKVKEFKQKKTGEERAKIISNILNQ